VRRLAAERSRTEQPAGVNSRDTGGLRFFEKIYGVTYADGSHEDLFALDATTYADHLAAAAAVLAGFQSYGVDIAAAEVKRREAEERLRERIYESFRAAGGFNAFAEHVFDGNPYATRDPFYNWRDKTERRPFADRDFGRFNHHAHGPRSTPERAAALDKCRKLKRLGDSTTFAGERDNADLRRRELMAKHGIEEREL
jgi:hypothetical protein